LFGTNPWDIIPRILNVGRKAMEQKQSDVLVLFGATGDLAYKKIFPAL
jgi:glucose-6-phosphate 1-dehydrogenase